MMGTCGTSASAGSVRVGGKPTSGKGPTAWYAVIGLVLTAPAFAQNCNIFTGGNPCNWGCPDACSLILCPGNACRCDPCRVGCSPGPCGSGCPDECSAIICPGNALCKSRCGGSTCNIGCSPGPCGSGCPDQCSLAICPQNHCSAACTAQPECDVLCGGDICGDGCPDECSVALCPGNALCDSGCGGDPCNIGCICEPACPNTACDLLCGGDPCNSGCPDECSPILCPINPCAQQTPCGGDGQRGCCVFEQVPSCDAGLVEDAPCTNTNCGFANCSLGTCVDPHCGGDGERACCFGEESSVVGHTCADGLIEVIGCTGDCACTGLTAIGSSTGTCVNSPCGGQGQRACCVDDPGGSGTGLLGSGCHAGLAEKGDCLSILGPGNCGSGLIPCSIGVCLEITECGGEGQRACCILEDVSIGACASGLVENGSCDDELGETNCYCGGVSLLRSSGVCKQPDCGGPGQRACCLLERIPSCNPGLIEDLTPGCAANPPPGGCDCGFGPGQSLGVCRALKGLGETGCDNVFDPCASGLTCLSTGDGNLDTICMPIQGDELFGDAVCAAFYNPTLHQAAISSGVTMTYGTAAAAAALAGGSAEVGVVYGADGCYGCYLSGCYGWEIDLAASLAACIGQGFAGTFDAIAGESCVTSVGADIPFVEIGASLSTSYSPGLTCLLGCIPDFDAPEPGCELLGTSECFSVGLGVNPVTVSAMECHTVTNLVACIDDSVSADGDLVLTPNESPTCIDGLTFVACPGSSIDLIAIALDPDGDALTYDWDTDCPGGSFDDVALAGPTFSLNPAASCSGLDCTVSVTTGGPGGAVACSARVTNDADAPEFTAFPEDVQVDLGASTDPSNTGQASAIDACDSIPVVSFSDSVTPGACPQAQVTTRTWTATDACGNTVRRDQIISVRSIPGDFDADADADLVDYDAQRGCLAGPSTGLAKGCACFDSNGDESVDLRDVAEFQTDFTGQTH